MAAAENESQLIKRMRQHSRVEVPFFAWIHADGQAIPAESCDFSLTGVHLRCDQRLPIGTPCRLVIELSNRNNEDLSVYCRARVSRHTSEGVALQIEHVEDDQGYQNLRNLLLLHAEDPGRAVRELDQAQDAYRHRLSAQERHLTARHKGRT